MKQLYCFTLHPTFSLDQAWEELTAEGLEIIYSSEDEENKQIYGYLEDLQALPHKTYIISSEPTMLPATDWEAQWATHGLNYQDGFVHIPLQQFSSMEKVLRLKPGPGFGDASHPTTRLMLSLMADYVPSSKTVIDIGCGSGILTVAAVAMGVQHAYGIDIDPEALQHAILNAKLNEMDSTCHFLLPQQWHTLPLNLPLVILMNMIMSEQAEAWTTLRDMLPLADMYLTSGIRKEERTAYLQQIKQWGWQLLTEREEEEWLSFAFIVD